MAAYCHCLLYVYDEEEDSMAMCHRLFLQCCYNEEGDGNLLPSPSSLVVLRFNLVVFGCL